MASLSSCAGSGQITKVELCREIPFIDGAEGACATTVSNESRLVNAEQWAKERPFMFMLSAKSWTAIKLDWLAGCRAVGRDCNVQVDSVDRVIKVLDELARKLIPIPVK